MAFACNPPCTQASNSHAIRFEASIVPTIVIQGSTPRNNALARVLENSSYGRD